MIRQASKEHCRSTLRLEHGHGFFEGRKPVGFRGGWIDPKGAVLIVNEYHSNLIVAASIHNAVVRNHAADLLKRSAPSVAGLDRYTRTQP